MPQIRGAAIIGRAKRSQSCGTARSESPSAQAIQPAAETRIAAGLVQTLWTDDDERADDEGDGAGDRDQARRPVELVDDFGPEMAAQHGAEAAGEQIEPEQDGKPGGGCGGRDQCSLLPCRKEGTGFGPKAAPSLRRCSTGSGSTGLGLRPKSQPRISGPPGTGIGLDASGGGGKALLRIVRCMAQGSLWPVALALSLVERWK